jgi:hypothetical protein
VPLHHHPARQDPGGQVAANEPQHSTVVDSLGHASHQHVVVHAVEKLLEIHVHHPAASFLEVLLRLAYGVVRAAPRSETVAVLREGRVESWLQDLQEGLLNESVERRWDAELSLPSVALRNELTLHRLGPVGAREQLLSKHGPGLPQVLTQRFHRHPVDAGTALVLLHALQRRDDVAALDDALHQLHVVCSRALVSAGRRRRFATSVYLRGFTPILERKLQLPGLLALGVSEIHGRFALLSVRPFAPSEASEGRGLPCSAPRPATTASADFSLRLATSPFQA